LLRTTTTRQTNEHTTTRAIDPLQHGCSGSKMSLVEHEKEKTELKFSVSLSQKLRAQNVLLYTLLSFFLFLSFLSFFHILSFLTLSIPDFIHRLTSSTSEIHKNIET